MRLNIDCVINFEMGHRVPTSMGTEWINERFKRYQDRIRKEAQERQWVENATAKYASLFDRLKNQVGIDIENYNRLFASNREECRALFSETPDGFRVEVGPKAVRVTKNSGTTVIGIEYVSTDRPGVTSGGGSDHLDVAPDDQGNIRYRHKAGALDDVNQASERILDPILCK